jgi:hypothetical protein
MWPNYPPWLSETSFDRRLLMVYLFAMGMLGVLGGGGIVSVVLELCLAGALAAGLIVLSIKNRRAKSWHWPGAGRREIVAALSTVPLLAVFVFAGTSGFPPNNPIFLPWYLAALGLGVFAFLERLRLVRTSQIDFEWDCRDALDTRITTAETEPDRGADTEPAIGADTEPVWKRRVRAAYVFLFMLVWLQFLAHFYLFGTYMRDGSPIWTETHTERLEDHGRVVYITREQEQLLSNLEPNMWVVIPFFGLLAYVLQNLLGVRMFATGNDQSGT